ncbi:MAG: hypothetical protein VKJ04_01610 [Vampirovibrionales bacterium]|nr:hypothetical protein [Vampirovibrionales bacterium]
MGSTAQEIISEAFRHHNLNEVNAFSVSQEFPYKIAKDILNDVLRMMNRMGSYWFTETRTALSYTPNQYAYQLPSLSIDPKRIIRVRREAAERWGDLKQVNWQQFQACYRNASIATGEPIIWSKFGNTLELNCIPAEDYHLVAYHFADLPAVVAPADTLLVPERDEDVLIDCCYQLLGYKMGRWSYQSAIQAMQVRIQPLLANTKQDAGIAYQMPAAF